MCCIRIKGTPSLLPFVSLQARRILGTGTDVCALKYCIVSTSDCSLAEIYSAEVAALDGCGQTNRAMHLR